MSLVTPEKIRTLQRALYVKAKQEPTRRFHFLYDKVWREDILAHAYALSRANGGVPGVDGETFNRIDVYGVDRWLDELREEIRTGRYKAQPVRRVMIPVRRGNLWVRCSTNGGAVQGNVATCGTWIRKNGLLLLSRSHRAMGHRPPRHQRPDRRSTLFSTRVCRSACG